jgi:hypothetical protein
MIPDMFTCQKTVNIDVSNMLHVTPILHMIAKKIALTRNLKKDRLVEEIYVLFICKTKSRLRPKALWPGASFQNRSYWDRSSLFWIREDTLLTSWRQLSSWADEQDNKTEHMIAAQKLYRFSSESERCRLTSLTQQPRKSSMMLVCSTP